jgi:hypothetical protein
VNLSTAEIPVIRVAGQLFTTAGWQIRRELVQYTRNLPFAEPLARPITGETLIRPLQPIEDLRARLADLSHRCAPGARQSLTYATFARWSSDERFAPDCLLLAEHDTTLVGAALVYPLAHSDPSEPTEALLADVLIDPALPVEDAAALRRQLSRRALTSACTGHRAQVVRALADATDMPTRDALISLGCVPRGLFRCYQPPKSTYESGESL